jgi:hypothetical protein
LELFRDDDLVIFFSDNSPKEFNSTFLQMMLSYATEWNLNHDHRRLIVWNYFGENHGGGAADGDGQTARKQLSNYQRNEGVSCYLCLLRFLFSLS